MNKELVVTSIIVTLREEKDALTINTTNKKRDNNIGVSNGDRVHITCRREYTKP